MMVSMLVAVTLAASPAGSPEKLVKHQAKKLTLQVPASWTSANEDGTEKFKAPTGDAFFTLDVGAVQSAGMKPQVCLDKILAAMGGGSWDTLKLGSNPAARRVNVDKANEDGSQKVRSITYVGCNGKTTWSLIFSVNDAKADQFLPMLTKITQSVSYAKGK